MGVIFISHSSRNNVEAVKVRDWLFENGWGPSQVFLDLDEFASGDRWRARLNEIGHDCEAVIACLSDDWITSPECAREFTHAESAGKPIFPVIVAPITAAIPRFVSDLQFVDLSQPTEVTNGFEKLRLGLHRARIGPAYFPWPPPSDLKRVPYRGLRALEEDDAAVFFGRDAQISRGLDVLRQLRGGAPHRILTIAAASGAGKSSFLKAGLLARLRRDADNFLVLPIWRPGRDALHGDTGLAQALGLASADLAASLAAKQAEVTAQLARNAFSADATWDRSPPSLVLPLDQAEELFSADNTTARAALDVLVRALALKPDLFVIATIRSDSLGGLQADARIADQLNLFSLPALQPSAFKDVIHGPAALAKPPIEIKPDLTDRLIADLNDADALPLLAFTLERLVMEFGSDNVLELHEYTQGLGGVKGAINAAVDAAFAEAANDPSLPDDRADLDALARAVFIPWLVQLDEADASPKRRVAKRSDLPEASRGLVRHFVNERLLVESLPDSASEPQIEVSHEAVLRNWNGLASWISEERFTLEGLQRILRSAQEWARQEKTLAALSADLLVHRGERLRAAEAYLQRPDMAQALRGLPLDYLKACRAAEDEVAARESAQLNLEVQRLAEIAAQQAQIASEQKKRTRQQVSAGLAILVVLGIAIVALAGAVLGFRQLHAQQSAAFVIAARSAMNDHQPDRALKLAAIANYGDWLKPAHPDAEGEVGAIAFASRLEATLYGHKDELTVAAFSPDGASIVTASDDTTARIWREGEDGAWTSTALQGHDESVLSAAFSPDGASIVTASDDTTARVWREGEDGAWTSTALQGHGESVLSAAFSPDGDSIVTASDDTTARIWREGEDGAWTSTALQGHGESVLSAAFSPDGASIVTASKDNTARVWREGEDGAWISAVLKGHAGLVVSAAFSPDGARIVTASVDDTARVWQEGEDGAWTSASLQGHSDQVVAAAFSPEGALIVTASLDATARVWHEGEDGAWISASLQGHSGQVLSAAFSPDGARIVTASVDGTARVWRDDENGTWSSISLKQHEGWVISAAFSPDGASIVTASDDTTALIWRGGEDSGWISASLQGHDGTVFSAVFSPDGARIVTASADSTARVWREGEDGAWTSAALQGHEEAVFSAAFSPDGARIVTASVDGTARVWQEGEDGAWTSAVLKGPTRSLRSAAFSPDGARIVTASSDSARVWRKGKDGAWTSAALQGNTGLLLSAAFSPDGARIVTASRDGTARVWRGGEDSAWTSTQLEGHGDRVYSAVFSPDGARIVTASQDGTARVWREGEDGAWISAALQGHDGAVFSAAFSPDGTRVVTASVDGNAHVWREGEDGAWTSAVLKGNTSSLRSAAFSPDGARIVTASQDGTARVWDARYVMGPEDWKAKQFVNPATMICRERMSQSAHDTINPKTGDSRQVFTGRFVTDADATALANLRPFTGQDVCDPLLNPPPWWHALAFWR